MYCYVANLHLHRIRAFSCNIPFKLSLIVVFGPIVGLIGLIGHAIKDAMSGGLWWTRIISSGLFGLFVGFFTKQIGEFKEEEKLVSFNVVPNRINLDLEAIAPVGDVLIYTREKCQ